MVTLVDADDYYSLSAYRWYAKKDRVGFYAARNYRIAKGKGSRSRGTVLMHRQILGLTDPAIKGDHRNHDTLDNRRSNIRACTNSENCRNKGAHSNNKLGLKGVMYRYYSNRKKNFRAAIMVSGKRISLGYFLTAEEAGRAYDEASKKYHGEYSKTNSTS